MIKIIKLKDLRTKRHTRPLFSPDLSFRLKEENLKGRAFSNILYNRKVELSYYIKYLVGLIIVILIAISSTRFFSKSSENEKFSFLDINYKLILKSNINIANYESEDKVIEEVKEKYTSRSGLIRILNMELLEIKEAENIKDETNEDNEEKEEQRRIVDIKDTFTNTYGSVTVKNLTNIKLTKDILKPDYNVKNKKDIIIYHTHTCESYTPTKENSYKASGNFRTTDLNYSVVRVGKKLESELKKLKFNVVRSDKKHDYPAYSGSYTRSLETIEGLLKKNSKAEIVFDIHRDAVGSSSNYAPTVEINGEKVAQLMFVIGTNDGGGKHPNWKNNLKFAVKVQEKANKMYPGLFRSINLRSATFNQKVTNAASIIEVGATGNTLEEATASMKYLAKVLDAVLNEK